MDNPKVNKIAEVMKKVEELAFKGIDGKSEDQLLVAAGLAAVTRNLYIHALGAEEAQKVFELMLNSFMIADEIVYAESYGEKPTIH